MRFIEFVLNIVFTSIIGLILGIVVYFFVWYLFDTDYFVLSKLNFSLLIGTSFTVGIFFNPIVNNETGEDKYEDVDDDDF